MARSYRELIVWQKAKKLAIHAYKTSDAFPKTERFGLASQIRRAAVSVVSNMAEGQGRITPGEFIHFLGLARGSLLELETQIDIAAELGYLHNCDQRALADEIYAALGLLNRLIEALRRKRSDLTLKP